MRDIQSKHKDVPRIVPQLHLPRLNMPRWEHDGSIRPLLCLCNHPLPLAYISADRWVLHPIYFLLWRREKKRLNSIARQFRELDVDARAL